MSIKILGTCYSRIINTHEYQRYAINFFFYKYPGAQVFLSYIASRVFSCSYKYIAINKLLVKDNNYFLKFRN